MTKSRRTGIRRSLEKLLFPELSARGFEHLPETNDPQLAPFGRFRRRGERGLELIEVTFSKYRTSHFRFHIAIAREGASVWKTSKPVEDMWSLDVDPNFLVWRRGLVFRRWFGVRKYARQGITEQEYDAAVQQAIDYLPMIERYFRHGSRSLLAMAKYPQGLKDDLAYWGWCAVGVLAPAYAMVWALGWLWRQL